MTNTGGTPAGWYHAPGDAEGTQRYWDGAQWIGEPQSTPQQSAAPQPGAADDATVSYSPPPAQGTPPPAYGGAPGGDAPNYAAPGAAAPGFQQAAPAGGNFVPGGTPVGGAPAGYQAFGAPGAAGVPAEWATRLVAYLIDIAPLVAGYIVVIIGGAISDVLGLLLSLVFFVAWIGYFVWNFLIQQGKTGQTIGKAKQGIKLINDETGQPLGAGMVFVRYIVAAALSFFTCGIGGLLDYLWPLWDPEKKRLTDKILKNSVVKV